MLFHVDGFAGFTKEDYDAFEERKWASNRFNIERMKTRARLVALGKELEKTLGEDRLGLVFLTTLDHPHVLNRSTVSSMWLYLDRPEEERIELARIVDKDLSLKEKVEDPIPQHQVALTGIEIKYDSVSVFLRMHANATLDRRNLSARLRDPMEVGQFKTLLARLDPSFWTSRNGSPVPIRVDDDFIAGLRGELDSSQGWFAIERTFPRDDPLPASPEFVHAASELLRPLLSIWRFAAWSRANDRLKIVPVLKEERKEKARRLAGLEPGDCVMVTGGLLAGKKGVVQAVDLKGRVKVLFGKVVMDIEGKLLRKT